MKPVYYLLLKILGMSLFFYFFVSSAHAQSQQVTVTAHVPEYLTYYKNGQDIIVLTNYQSGYYLGQTFNLSGKNFVLVVNF